MSDEPWKFFGNTVYTIDSRYIMVIYNSIVCIAQQLQL